MPITYELGFCQCIRTAHSVEAPFYSMSSSAKAPVLNATHHQVNQCSLRNLSLRSTARRRTTPTLPARRHWSQLTIAHQFAIAVDLVSVRSLAPAAKTALEGQRHHMVGLFGNFVERKDSDPVAQGAPSYRLLNEDFFSKPRMKRTRRGSICKVLKEYLGEL